MNMWTQGSVKEGRRQEGGWQEPRTGLRGAAVLLASHLAARARPKSSLAVCPPWLWPGCTALHSHSTTLQEARCTDDWEG